MPEDREREEKETYTKVDRRVGHESESDTPEASLPQSDPEPAASPTPDEGFPEDLPQDALEIDVYGLLRMVLGMFAEQAWVQMGVQLAPGAKELKSDLKQARIAIDTVNYIKEALGDTLSAAEVREVESLLATLRMNFVQRT